MTNRIGENYNRTYPIDKKIVEDKTNIAKATDNFSDNKQVTENGLQKIGLFNIQSQLQKFRLDGILNTPPLLAKQKESPQTEDNTLDNRQKAQQAQQEWLDTLKSVPPDNKSFSVSLPRGLAEDEQSFYFATYKQAETLLGNGKSDGLYKGLSPHYATLDAMGRIANRQIDPKIQPTNWKSLDGETRTAYQIANLARKYPPGTKFALVNYIGSVSGSFPYNPTIFGNKDQSNNPLIDQYKNYRPTEYNNLAIAVTIPQKNGESKTEFFQPALNGNPPVPAYYPMDISSNNVLATIDVSHLTTGVRPAEIQATVNISGIEHLTDKNENAIFANYDKFVSANFSKYLYLRGDEPRELSGSNLSNEIGMALKLKPNNEPQTEAEKDSLSKGEWNFYKDTQAEQVAKVEQAIRQIGGDNAKVTVLPIMLDTELPNTSGLNAKRAIIEVPLFRVAGQDGKEYFVDDIGRTYSDFNDWKNNNQLPVGKMSYPTDGHLIADSNGKPQFETSNTPNVKDTVWEYVRPILDGAALVGGVIVAGLLIAGTDGLAIPLVAGAISGYGASRSGATLYDRFSHKQSLSLADSEARSEWINLGSNVLGVAALGASVRAINLANKGIELSSGVLRTVTALNVASQYADTLAIANTGYSLATNWDKISTADKMTAIGQMAFWGGMQAYSAKQAGGVRNLYGAEPMVKYVEQLKSESIQLKRTIDFGKTVDADVKLTSDGLATINNQLTVHPSKLAEMTNAELEDLVRITKQVDLNGGDQKAFSQLSTDDRQRLQEIRRDHNFRFEYQRGMADDLIRDLGVSGEPMFRNLSEAERSRLNQALVVESLPKTTPKRADGQSGVPDLQQQAANWALKEAKTPAQFADHYQFYLAQFKRLLADKVQLRDEKVEAELAKWREVNPNASKEAIDNERKRIEQLIIREDGHDAKFAREIINELGTTDNVVIPGEKSKQLIDDVYQTESKYWQGKTGETRLIMYPSERVSKFTNDQLEAKTRQIADRLSFGEELTATYHTRKHFLEIADSTEVIRDGNNNVLEAESYLSSARKTIREGKLTSVSTYVYGESKSLVFERELSNGKIIKAIVAVTDNGEAKLLTYFTEKNK